MSEDITCSLCPPSGPPIPPHPQSAAGHPAESSHSDDDATLSWICCTKCRAWYHGVCVLINDEGPRGTIPALIRSHLEATGMRTDWTKWVGRWFCRNCITRNENLVATIDKSFPPKIFAQRKREATESIKSEDGHRPKRAAALNRPDYHALHHHIATPTARWLDLIQDPGKYGVKIAEDNFPRISAEKVRKESLEGEDPIPFCGTGRVPIIISPSNGGYSGLGGSIPPPDITVNDVARLVGPERMVDVIDVATQSSSQWKLQKWAEYIGSDSPAGKIYNVISLEITGTKLGDQVKPPALVREIDWVDNFWNFGPGGKSAAVREEGGAKGTQKREPWPKVQLYCLMGAKGSWTDWHVDFAASSVYYTIHTGAKTFFFIRPTTENLAAYADWSGSYEKQQSVWLGDLCDEVRKVELKRGDTMMIPAGYIHAVYTPEDSIVFGGNFLHSYDIPVQLRLRQIEIDTKVPQRFRFPSFDRLCWYVAQHYTAQLRANRAYRRPSATPPPSATVLQGMVTLAEFLVGQCDIMDDPEAENKRRKLIHDRIPDTVTDAPALARELLWRAHRELASAEPESVVTPPVRKAPMSLPKRESRLWNPSATAWDEQASPITQQDHSLLIPRPDVKGNAPAPADERIRTRSQTRRRVRETVDGTLVMEEQSTVFTERTVVWGANSCSH